MRRISSDRWWRLPFLGSLLVSLLLLLSFSLIEEREGEVFIDESKVIPQNESNLEPPRIAYLITGTKGDSFRMRRTLQAVYHPRNQYVLHLDMEAPPRERIDLSAYVRGDPVFSAVENVQVIAKGNLVTYKGPTMVACTLHAVAVLLRAPVKWDWFINLSASDYPLVTQDDLLHVLSSLPRHLNFIELNRLTGWKENQRARPIIIDPGLYLSKKFDVFVTTLRRPLPTSFKLFTGSAWVTLSRAFAEHCIGGWESEPRELLMYYANSVSSPEGYFQTVICNSDAFHVSTISHDLHYIAWDNPPKQHPRTLSLSDYSHMVSSGAPFARKFRPDDPVLDKIDAEILHRPPGKLARGAWCLGPSNDPCQVPKPGPGATSLLRPGPAARRLEALMHNLLLPDGSPRNLSCSSL